MKKKLIMLFAASIMGAMLLTGCGGGETKTETSETQEEAQKDGSETVEKPSYDWSTGELATHIPLPDTEETSIDYDDEKIFKVFVNGGEDKYKEYIKACKDAGYTYINSEIDGYFNAWNEEGYRLEVDLDGTQYSVQVKPSLIQNELSWPGYGLATMIPNPEKERGTIIVDGELNFTALVADVEKDEFKTYVDKVMEAGFNVDYDRNDSTLNAKNSNGDSVFIHYGGYKAMQINIYKADEEDLSE